MRKEEADNTQKSLANKDSCPLCLQKINPNHKHKINSEKEESLKKISLRLNQLHSQGKHKTETMKQLEEQHKKVLIYDRQLIQLEVEVSNLKSTKKNLDQKNLELTELIKQQKLTSKELEEIKTTNIKETKNEILELKNKLVTIQEEKLKLKDKEHSEKQVCDIKEELTTLKNRDESLSNNNEKLKSDLELVKEKIQQNLNLYKDLNNIKKILESMNTEKHKLELERASLSKEKESANNILKDLDGKLKTKLGLKKELNKSNLTMDWLKEHFINLINVLEKNIMAQLYQEFNSLFTEWFDLLMDDEVISARLDETFTPMIDQNGYEVEIISLSGGEKTCLALAYRLALNKVINDFITSIKTKDIIILDEPTDGFSTEQLDKIKDVLDQLKVKQSIIVSHEPKIESFVNNVIRIDKQEHLSSVSYNS